ncbi:hypothetical protein [Nocardioides sp. YIM 152588]|uniref:hypothetical protein n=1 Tax=Nocardioides sp. YIM 152588 TaxID=3158259 RepID=UPI0032E4D012
MSTRIAAFGSTATPALAELRRELVTLVRTAPASLRRVHRSVPVAAVVGVWLAGTLGDAWTTLAMMSSGVSEEGNPVAAAGMAVLGVLGYVLAASLVCAALCWVNVGRPTGLYSWTVVATLTVIGCAKCWQAVDNALLWASLT